MYLSLISPSGDVRKISFMSTHSKHTLSLYHERCVALFCYNERHVEGYIEGYVDIFWLNEGVCFDHTKDIYTYVHIRM
jgi:hypothetical protein